MAFFQFKTALCLIGDITKVALSVVIRENDFTPLYLFRLQILFAAGL